MHENLANKVLDGKQISRDEAVLIARIESHDIFKLFSHADKLRKKYHGDNVELCAIVNAKSGACSEDCIYCAQSSKNKSDIPVYPLMTASAILGKAKEAKDSGVKRFSIVTSGKKANRKELREIAAAIKNIRDTGILPCASLGLLDKDELCFLKDNGLERYHHNLETSERFFPEICSTHSYSDKLRTIEAAQSAGLSVCSGGIFGMGETWEDRIDMAIALRELGVDSVPVNFLIPIKGTLLENQAIMSSIDALKIISLYRFILPQKQIRICGGRLQVLGKIHSMVFTAGADSLMTGNYLTTTGRNYSDDLRLIKDCGLKI
ncbi:MAG: biotin synthase BioB [Nitrospiraceae bacterium]|nr:biotin synthase BioB [Nitrospiraceae bacterium]